ncbi:hypothetical protein TEU_07460 [Thermococcus eurythermalis]|uniref:Uncharacterized protein n=1 Tax=Thermococcus eurythermalis TaxID=1505907 RepID=A0A097QUM6_9EURY|nr:hypothetical protein [Thermococcus eurythermalis]AIU70181.1 hypothetical protein TEU_07460 [Thermococcus eurythermalis]
MEPTKTVAGNLDRWDTAFKALGKAVLFFLWTTLLAFVISLPAQGVLYLIGVPRQFYITAFVGYAVFNFSVNLKNLNEITELIRDPKVSIKALIGVSIILTNVLFIVYPLIGWILTRWVSPEVAVWIPFFLMWWEITVISGERKVLQYFTVAWLMVIVVKIIVRLFSKSGKESEFNVKSTSFGSPVGVVVALLVASLRK